MKQGHPAQLTVRDAGKTIATETPVEERKIGEQIKSLTCRANAWLAIPGAAPNADRDVVFTLYRPVKNDETADAAMLCKLPAAAADPSADESQRAAIAAQVYIEQLTSVRYRSWFFQMDRELAAAQSDSDRVTVKQANGEKLVAMLGPERKRSECWFAKVLAAARP